MPFSLAHPAAVIPLKKHTYGRHLILSALIVGSIVPDFGYFVPLDQFVGFSHSIWGLISFDLLVGLLTLWIFHKILKNPLVSLLPGHHRQLLLGLCIPFPFSPWSRFFPIVISLLIGASTHLAWDSMTHGYGWLVQHVPLFQVYVSTFGVATTKLYFVFKHSSTLLGLALLIYWYWQWFRRQSTGRALSEASTPLWKYVVISMIFIIFASVGGMILAALSLKVGYESLSLSVKWVVASLGISAFACSLIFRVFKDRPNN